MKSPFKSLPIVSNYELPVAPYPRRDRGLASFLSFKIANFAQKPQVGEE